MIKTLFFRLVFTSLFLFLSLISSSDDLPKISVTWTKGLQGDYNIYPAVIEFVQENSIVMVGGFEGSLIILGDTIAALPVQKGFVGKLDSLGNWKWFKVFDSEFYSHLNAIKEGDGVFYFSGSYRGNINIDGFVLSNENYLSTFIGTCDYQGNILWISDIGINTLGGKHYLDTTNNDKIVFGSEVTGSFQISDSLFNIDNNRHIFISQLNGIGEIETYKVFPSKGALNLNGLCTLENNDILIGATFTDTTYVGNNTINPSGLKDFFVARLDSMLQLVWVNVSRGDGYKELSALKMTPLGDILGFVAYKGTLIIVNKEYLPVFLQGLMVFSYDIGGNALWQKSLSGFAGINPASITQNADDSFYLLFNFRGQIEIKEDEKIFSLGEGYDYILLKMTVSGEIEWAEPALTYLDSQIRISGKSMDGKIKGYFFNEENQTIWNAPFNGEETPFISFELIDCGFANKPERLNDTIVCFNSIIDAGPGFETYLWSSGFEGRFFKPDSSGVYIIEYTDLSGCKFRDSLFIEVLPRIEAQITGGRGFCPSGEIILDAGEAAHYLWSTGSQERYLNVIETGYYSVLISNEFLCTDSTNVFIEEFTLPALEINDDYYLTVGEQLVIFPGDFISYYWSDGTTNSIFSLNTEDLAPGIYEYSLFVTDNNYCDQQKYFFIHVFETEVASAGNCGENETVNGKSIENQSLFEDAADDLFFDLVCDFKIIPNPNKGQFFLEFPNSLEDLHFINVKVSSIQGRVTKEFETGTQQFEVRDLPKGVYFVQVLSNEKYCPARFVIVQ